MFYECEYQTYEELKQYVDTCLSDAESGTFYDDADDIMDVIEECNQTGLLDAEEYAELMEIAESIRDLQENT